MKRDTDSLPALRYDKSNETIYVKRDLQRKPVYILEKKPLYMYEKRLNDPFSALKFSPKYADLSTDTYIHG